MQPVPASAAEMSREANRFAYMEQLMDGALGCG